ncbi:MAG TPA: transcription antitermination factor NusB [Candidatus Hydrogenedentes bacterium]|nr:transcription antitermination factor NusB [Candidatus Hydrogenedentota bacterium]
MSRFKPQQKGRQLAFQFIFGIEYMPSEWTAALAQFWEMNPAALGRDYPAGERDADVTAVRADERAFSEKLICGVMEHKKELDSAIVDALDNWAPARVGRMEWAILRLAAYELLYDHDTPHRVVLSEAMRLGDLYGEENTARFVNGILNRIIDKRETGES